MENNKQEKMIILGPSGSGKDYLRTELLKFGLRYSPKFTTRPPRSQEVDGVDYLFIEESKFQELNDNYDIKVSETFIINGDEWRYGITKENWNNNQIFIMTCGEFNQLTSDDRKNCFVVYLNIDEETRKTRLLERKDYNDSIERRIHADEKDFEGFTNYDLSITDPEFETEWIYQLMY
jgi:guanylate kinase